MNQQDQINHISNASGESKAAVERILKAQATLITEQLQTAGKYLLHYGIGTIVVTDTAARKGRNPATGEAIDIPAGKRIKLKAAKALKDAVAG